MVLSCSGSLVNSSVQGRVHVVQHLSTLTCAEGYIYSSVWETFWSGMNREKVLQQLPLTQFTRGIVFYLLLLFTKSPCVDRRVQINLCFYSTHVFFTVQHKWDTRFFY